MQLELQLASVAALGTGMSPQQRMLWSASTEVRREHQSFAGVIVMWDERIQSTLVQSR